jgi:hypothetical protein
MPFPETFLDGMQITVSRKAFNCFDLASVSLDCKHGARFNSLAINHNRASAAQRCFAADVSSGQVEHVSQIVDEQHPWFDFVTSSDTIHVEADSFFHELPHFAVLEFA